MTNYRRLLFTALAVSAMASTSAFATEFAGSSSGAFNGSGTTFQGLTFYSSTFDKSTVGNIVSFSGAPTAGPNVDNFGAIQLSTAPYADYASTFALTLTFTMPTGIQGGQAQTFQALVTGSVTNGTSGGVHINYDGTTDANPTAVYNFTFGTTGQFTLLLNNVSINPGSIAGLNGTILVASGDVGGVPEPATFGLLGLGLVGAALFKRYRRQ